METLGFKVVIFVFCVIGHTAICSKRAKGRQYFSRLLKFWGLCCGIAAVLIALMLYYEGGCWAIILALICWGLIRWGTIKSMK